MRLFQTITNRRRSVAGVVADRGDIVGFTCDTNPCDTSLATAVIGLRRPLPDRRGVWLGRY